MGSAEACVEEWAGRRSKAILVVDTIGVEEVEIYMR
jgi:hypothetical protein